MISTLLFASALLVQSPVPRPSAREPLPFAALAGRRDAVELLSPSDIHVGGWLGRRIDVNASNRLLNVDTEPLLAGYRKKPGNHPWIGQHIGKWMHAATLAWAYTRDPKLKAKLDQAAAELVACQEPDGYLGTYIPSQRFGLFDGADWDVWSHKYNLLGLLTYYQYTGNQPALLACRKVGDLLIRTFGQGKKSILSAGTHMGMAATSILEPVVLLYRCTSDARYLDFARYIVRSWDELGGPRIMSTLLTVKQVNKTANGKAYEMLSNLVGLCELARATGDMHYSEPALNAWQDIVDKRLYITGSASRGECFGDDYELPNQMSANICETCVTTTWIQLNLQLLRLTGDAKFANEIEKSLYNDLAAAQNPRGDDWCYYTALEGTKPYDSGITCCHSSGPRGMALAPQTAFLRRSDGGEDTLIVNTFETASASVSLGGRQVRVSQASKFPFSGGSQIGFQWPHGARFGVDIRVAPWLSSLTISLRGQQQTYTIRQGWAHIPARNWASHDTIEIGYQIKPRLIQGEHGNLGLAALAWGPFVMAYDGRQNPALPAPNAVRLANKPDVRFVPGAASPALSADVGAAEAPGRKPAVFIPFADAGATGGTYRVWVANQ